MKDNKDKIIERPPVVAILGHIDHGKSTLLDYIRKTKTTEKEEGGITQHISAYEVEKNGKKITFIDTPGHQAFVSQRERGASIADIVILIVSAEDGVKEQTVEALKSIKKTDTPFLVAINKTDSEKADVEKTISSLGKQEIYLEGRGGNIPYSLISAKTGSGVEELLETILLMAEMEELKGEENAPADGYVLEAHRNERRGTSATLLITNGKLEIGMYVATPDAIAPVRTIENTEGDKLERASFSSPVVIHGWNTLPETGGRFSSFLTKKEAEGFSKKQLKNKATKKNRESQSENELKLLIKADTTGSIDAIEHEVKRINKETQNCKLNILDSDVGNITETDIKNTGLKEENIILGFNVKVDADAKELAERQKIELQTFNIIYKLSEWLEERATKEKDRAKETMPKGEAVVLKTFSSSGARRVVGARVEKGVVFLKSKIIIVRDGEKVGDGKPIEIQMKKKTVESVPENTEFGIDIKTTDEILEGDILEFK